MNDLTFTVTRPVTEHGWMRRPEFDGKITWAWELPNGDLRIEPEGEMPMLTTLLPMKDIPNAP